MKTFAVELKPLPTASSAAIMRTIAKLLINVAARRETFGANQQVR